MTTEIERTFRGEFSPAVRALVTATHDTTRDRGVQGAEMYYRLCASCGDTLWRSTSGQRAPVQHIEYEPFDGGCPTCEKFDIAHGAGIGDYVRRLVFVATYTPPPPSETP